MIIATAFFLGACTSRPEPPGDGMYFKVSIRATTANMRAQDSNHSINQDAKDHEDYVDVLRMIVSELDGTVVSNEMLDVVSGTAAFKVSEAGNYNLTFIANEPVELKAELDAIATEAALNTVYPGGPAGATLSPVSHSENIWMMDDEGAIGPRRFPMTAQYKNVAFVRGGSESAPKALVLPTPTTGVELMRTLAKVNILIKKSVFYNPEESDPAKRFRWIGPAEFGRVLEIELTNMPKDYPLMPMNTTYLGEIFEMIYTLTLGDEPLEDFVVMPEEDDEGGSIGGARILDLSIPFYIAECLLEQDASDVPSLTIRWMVYHGGAEVEKEEVFPIQNGSGSTGYEEYYKDVTPHASSIYRNRLYEVNINLLPKS